MTRTCVLLISALSLCTWPAWAQDSGPKVKMLGPDGKEIPQGSTKIILRAPSGKVPVRLILEQSQSSGYGSDTRGWTMSETRAEKYRPLCDAPCAFELPNGRYRLRAGTFNSMTDMSKEFDLTARGGEQVWEVRDTNGGLTGTGFVLFSVGLGLLLTSPIPYFLGAANEDTEMQNIGAVMAVSSLPMIALGSWLGFSFRANAVQVGGSF